MIDRWHEQKGKDDVSGSKHGVRCEGYCVSFSPELVLTGENIRASSFWAAWPPLTSTTQGPKDPRDPQIIEFNNAMGHYSKWTTGVVNNLGRVIKFKIHCPRLNTTLTKAATCIKPITGTREAS